MIAGDRAVVEIIDPQVEEDVQNECKIKEGKIEAIDLLTHPVLDPYLDPEEPERFDQQIEEDQQGQVGEETLFQTRSNLGGSLG